jgi:signal transduction histidine kinase
VVLYGAAAVGFTRRASREHDELATWFGVACVLAAFAYLNYFLFPSLYSEWVYTGDLLRLAFHLVLLLGAAREIAGYQRGLAEAAVVDERRRMARDLHDGLAQELAFIGSQSKRLAARDSDGAAASLEQLAAAADRALDESRDVISALTRPLDAPLDRALAEAAESVVHRFGARVELDLAPGVHVAEETSAELCRIVREAVTNACRHGGCETVRVALSTEAGLRVAVTDDGQGFDQAASPGGGFGLTSMKERAHRIGGRFTVRSHPGRGAEVEVMLP